jgi:hypothetical protein
VQFDLSCLQLLEAAVAVICLVSLNGAGLVQVISFTSLGGDSSDNIQGGTWFMHSLTNQMTVIGRVR